MLFAILTNDVPNGVPLRMETRPVHLDWLNGLGDKLAFAGPFTDEEGSPTGSLVVIEADDLAAAKALAAEDPYAKAGLFASTEVRPWRWALKNPNEA